MQEDKFHPELLKIARESRSLSQTDLAKKLEIPQVLLSRVENGNSSLNEFQQEKLSFLLGYPKSFFYSFDIDINTFNECFSFHRKKTTPKSIEQQLNAKFKILQLSIFKIFKEFSFSVPSQELNLSNLSPNNAAIELRKSWNLGVGPINDLSLLLKRNNIFAFNFDFFTSHIDGVSTKNKYLPPVICANYQSTDRLRFTFAHELGHIVLHQNTFPTEDIEEEANQFAAELLLPEISVKDELRNLKFSRLPALKQRWKVSMSSIIYRAKELNLISTETASSYFMRLNQLGYRKKEPYNESIKESEGTLFKDVVDHISLSKSISVKEISQKAGLSLREFNQLL